MHCLLCEERVGSGGRGRRERCDGADLLLIFGWLTCFVSASFLLPSTAVAFGERS